MPSTTYKRIICLSGTLFIEHYTQISDEPLGVDKTTIALTDKEGNIEFSQSKLHLKATGEVIILPTDSPMPNGYYEPSLRDAAALSKTYAASKGETIPRIRNGVAYGVKDFSFRLLTTKLMHIDAEGEKIPDAGKITIPCGEKIATDKTAVETLLRLFKEQLGIDLTNQDYIPIGELYDASNGRMLDVFHVTAQLDFLYDRQLEENPAGLPKALVRQDSLAYYKEDLDAEIAVGGVTSLTIMLLDLFKEFEPDLKNFDVKALENELKDIE